jgi:hypothetical protein
VQAVAIKLLRILMHPPGGKKNRVFDASQRSRNAQIAAENDWNGEK